MGIILILVGIGFKNIWLILIGAFLSLAECVVDR